MNDAPESRPTLPATLDSTSPLKWGALGGLLGAHTVSQRPHLLDAARDIGERLSRASVSLEMMYNETPFRNTRES